MTEPMEPREPWRTGPALIKCTAVWCGPCKRVAPLFQALAERREVPCYEVDIDADGGFSAEFEVRLLPTFLLLHDGVELARVEGADWSRVEQMLASRTLA